MSTAHCSVCSAPARLPFRAPAAELAPDLDHRPGEPDSVESALRLVDILRRAGDYDGAAARARTLDDATLDENSAAILAFQRERVAAHDPGRHMISRALRPPARRPHVTHGRAEPAGFWARLFGR